jgi:hypothetical protein
VSKSKKRKDNSGMQEYVILSTIMLDGEIRISPESYCDTHEEAWNELQKIFSSKLSELYLEDIEYRLARCEVSENLAEIRGIDTTDSVENWAMWAILPIKRKENT